MNDTGHSQGSGAFAGQAGFPCVPDHKLLRRIGQGSYGEVWLGRGITGAYRAIKIVYRSKFQDDRPFEREFTGIRKFEPISRTHGGLVSILHVGRNDSAGYFYYIMELADDLARGASIRPAIYLPRTLQAELGARGRLPMTECLRLGRSLASAVQHLHENELIHRDIKPSNIIFVRGEPELADVGLVTAQRKAESFVGTIGYIPPEGPGTPQSDIYSLGKVLYEIATGKDRERFPEPPTALNDGENYLGQFRAFNEVFLKACEDNPRLRFQSARELGEAIVDCGRRSAASRIAPRAQQDSALAQLGQKRKFLTALCVEITGVEGIDPEESQRLSQRCVDRIQPVVERYGGALIDSRGECVLATFGAPVACEDHARRAAHAALELAQALARGESRPDGTKAAFEARFGLSTGLAMTGRKDARAPFGASGEPINLAARLLAFAEPNEILATEETCRLLSDFFFTRAVGEKRFPGKSAPVQTFHLTGVRGRRSSFAVRAERGLTPFVGRGRELSILQEHFDEAREGRGQIVLVVGEAGLGKSRLLLEFQNTIQPGQAVCLVGSCVSFGGQMPYLPIVELLKRLLQVEESDDEDQAAARIRSALVAYGSDGTAFPLLKRFLAAGGADEPAQKLDPQQRRVQTLEAVRKTLFRAAEQLPLILIVEDLHWIDKASLDFLLSLADSLAMVRVLMVLSYRPDFQNPFPERSYVTRLGLRQLDEKETHRLAGEVLPQAKLPAEVRQLVVAKAEGNPFFVEELIKSLVETGMIIERGGAFDFARAPGRIQVPDTIQDVILARIERLDESRRKALQLASVIGREFSVSLLATIADLQEPLTECLQELKALELIYERSLYPEHLCIFKHALTQEVAYHSLLIQTRKELHSLVAAAIEELYSARLPEFYGLLAWHYEQGEEWERALDYLQKAAERSRRVAAHREESSLLTRAMVIAERLGQNDVVATLRGKRGSAWSKVGMWREAKSELETALAALSKEEVERRAELLLDLAGVCNWGLDVPALRQCATEGYPLALQAERADLIAGMTGWLAAAEGAEGRIDSALELYERAASRPEGQSCASFSFYPITLYWCGRISEAVTRGLESKAGLTDTWASTFGNPHLGLALGAAGRYAEAQRVFDEACQSGKKYENWKFRARARSMSAGLYLDLFDFESHREIAAEALEDARAADFAPTVVHSSLDLAFNQTRQNEVPEENVLTEIGHEIEKIGGWHRWLTELRLRQVWAERALIMGNYEDALARASSSILECRRGRRAKYEIAALETRARALNQLGCKHEAIQDLNLAVNLARRVGDPAMLLRSIGAHLALEGSDALLNEGRTVVARISEAIPTPQMRATFLKAIRGLIH